jgi:hypothetical protein
VISGSTPYSLPARGWPGEFAVVAAQAHHLEAHLVARDAGSGHHMGGVAEQEHALAGQVGAVDDADHQGMAQAGFRGPFSAVDAGDSATSATKSRVAPTPIGTTLV